MEKELIFELIKIIEQKKQERDDLVLLKEEYQMLENNPIVLRYLELKSCQYRNVKSDKDIILNTMRQATFYKKSSNIYVYMGKYKYDNSYDSRADFCVAEDDLSADYCAYQDIETEEVIHIKISLVNQFENNNIIIKNILYPSSNIYVKQFYKLQEIYFLYIYKKKDKIHSEDVVKILKK